jgi:cell division protease FtsH
VENLRAGRVLSDPAHPLEMVVSDTRTTQSITGFLSKPPPDSGKESGGKQRFYTDFFVPLNAKDLAKELDTAGVKMSVRPISEFWPQFVVGILPLFLLIGLFVLFAIHQSKVAGKSPWSVGKYKPRTLTPCSEKITFESVAGIDESREEVSELVEFLRDPKKFQSLGGKMPKGILLSGPPGTGKTLLARAIAGEAGVPFYSISGSDFVEMFVGVGASRVRDLFEQGKKNAPCIIFIDEIDAVGRHRGHGIGSGHDEREQTLNALLVEMDGFDTQSGIIILASTNRADVLDPALLRPGRFDRRVEVVLPDVAGREAILKVHAKKIKMSASVDLKKIARATPGYSGADLASLINEAAILAAGKNLESVSEAELEEARDKVRWGRERKSLVVSASEKETTAFHEAGHALLMELLEHSDPLHKVTVVPRGSSLGSTMSLPSEDKHNLRKLELDAHLVVLMGGRAAEEIVFGDVTTGAQGDIRQATALVRKMVCEWGMGDASGMVDMSNGSDHVFIGRDMGKSRAYSEKTAATIDSEIKKIIDKSYNRAKSLLTENRSKLEKIARALVAKETLSSDQLRVILESAEQSNRSSA